MWSYIQKSINWNLGVLNWINIWHNETIFATVFKRGKINECEVFSNDAVIFEKTGYVKIRNVVTTVFVINKLLLWKYSE